MSTLNLTGKHLIASEWVASENSFTSSPASGPARKFFTGTPDHIDQAAAAAEKAFHTYGWISRAKRAEFLRAIAHEIDAVGDAVTEIGVQETGLPELRLKGERARTVGQLRLFADHIESSEYLDLRHDSALPERKPIPRPDLRLIQRPIGPVAVFGASNFPLAFSTAGGDTAAALAAGCPVVFKGHSSHPGTGEVIAQAIAKAIHSTGLPAGVFSLVQGGSRTVGTHLVKHPLIQAVGFTGSLTGGRALFDLCAARPEPIPFFGELGSINPIFLLPEAVKVRGVEIAQGWATSLTMDAGQFCTCPGVVVAIESPETEAFVGATVNALSAVGEQTMLTDRIAQAYGEGAAQVAASEVKVLLSRTCDRRKAAPNLFQVSAKNWLANDLLQKEVFGPLGIVVTARNAQEMQALAGQIEGQLTCSIHMEKKDTELARQLIPLIERKAGRLLVNGFPTGVEVSDAMVHGGPYPASTNFGATSVGTLSIRRFLRPVCYQNIPPELLPEAV